MKKKIKMVMLTSTLILGVFGTAMAVSNYLSEYNRLYGTSASCTLCHTTGSALNATGLKFLNSGRDYASIAPASPPPAQDTVAPSVTAFVIPTTSETLTVAINAFAAQDNTTVTGFRLTETATKPASSGTGWSATPPAAYTFASAGTKTLYAWAKDAAGNISTSLNRTVAITLPTPTPTPTPTPPVAPEAMETWNNTWFKVVIRTKGVSVEGLELNQERDRAVGYLNITAWDPAQSIFQSTLYQHDQTSGVSHSISLPLVFVSGDSLNLVVSSQVTGTTPYGFTARIKGTKRNGVLKNAKIKTLGGYVVSTLAGDNTAADEDQQNMAQWLKIQGRIVPAAKVPALN
jgi:hypothetical protein